MEKVFGAGDTRTTSGVGRAWKFEREEGIKQLVVH